MKTVKIIILLLVNLAICFCASAQSDEDCMMCHEDRGLTTVKQGRTVSLFVNVKTLKHSVHKKVKCASCHKDAAVDFPHPEQLKKVNCGNCHSSAMRNFNAGLHGRAFKKGEMYAPDCKECHGKHDVLSHLNPKSRTYKMNIPLLCGKCHRENAPVTRMYNIGEHNILKNYSQDIHGKGLYKSGLIVTATCNNCHGNHRVLPHTDPLSSTSPKNIAKTCMKCHARIEEVHKKIINQKLWEKEPGKVPSCSDCHLPHKVKIENITETMSVQSCLKCHGKDNIYKIQNGDTVSLKVNLGDIRYSVHKNITCVKCHSDVSPDLDRPCETAGKIDCSNCHVEVSNMYFDGGHGQAYLNKDKNAPYCTNCHGTHKILSKNNDQSPIFRTAIPGLCGSCHKKGGKANKGIRLDEVEAYSDYSLSVHGKGMTDKGLLVSAVCTDCHTSHYMLRATDERSSVYPKNVPATCAKCHKGIYDEYIKSDHAINKEGKERYPTCVDCHSAHTIINVKQDLFMTEVMIQCGSCHKDLAATYLDTYHGQAYQLGYEKSAKCSDCHNAHLILNMNNPNSSIGRKNIVKTCQKCHKDANKKFTGYLTHATHYNRKKFPLLYYTYWAMTFLLISVFGFFGIHTLLWLPRSLRERRRKKKLQVETGEIKYFRRFTKSQSITHIFVIVSFLLLALTGMMVKFSDMAWAKFLIRYFGGVEGAGNIHRFGAILTFGYFGFHVYSMIRQKIRRKKSLKEFVFGKNSLMFNKQDIKDFIASVKWFLGKGPRPKYGRWTYWEKFDYMAVFWGVAVIGFSGLMLWFPEFFSKFLPGKFINVAQIIHSDEALLAVGFIFTVHFFNTHLRPESFPMDTVIFTGHVPAEEYKEDRPREYQELEKEGKLDKLVTKRTFSKLRLTVIRTFGFLFLATGIILVVLIIYSLLTG